MSEEVSVKYNSVQKGSRCQNGMTLPPTPSEASSKPAKKQPAKKGK